MKLNETCMKDVLQFIVDNATICDNGAFSGCSIFDVQKQLSPRYSKIETAYAIKKLVELKYIILNANTSWNEYSRIDDVTYEGHKYLNNK